MPPLAARPATFNPTTQKRRSLLGKVHIAKKLLGLTDDDYRGVLLRITNKMSAADCDEFELVAVIEDLKTKGFKPTFAKGKAVARPADHPSARKARALWISLHQLGAIENVSEAALEGFARRQLGVERLQWANQALMYKLVEALKAIAERNGWSQDLAGVSRVASVFTLKRRLCDAILLKLQEHDLASPCWTLDEAAFRLLGHTSERSSLFWEIGTFDLVAKGLGEKLRMDPLRERAQ